MVKSVVELSGVAAAAGRVEEGAEAVTGVLVLDVESAVGELLEPLGVRRGVNMEKNFFTPCWPLGCEAGEDEDEDEDEAVPGWAEPAAGGELGGGGDMSHGGGMSTAAGAEAAALLDPEVRRLNMATER